ncbi:threonine--tRNA ligase [Pseudomonadota bacterium]
MIKIQFPNGIIEEFDSVMNGFKIAKSLSEDIAKNAAVMKLDGKIVDLGTTVDKDSSVKIIVASSDEGLEVIRHSTAHLMAEAVKRLYPDVKVTIGPSVENGFYYDFDREESFSSNDLEKIEKEMVKVAKADEKFIREEWSREKAHKFFKDSGEKYKLELLDVIPEGEKIGIYKLGSFVDLCRGPHVPSSRYLKHFKLMKVAGAYWRGDSNNPMLQRIYGTAWATKEDLENYLRMLEEAEKRDHRKVGLAMDLFHFEPEYAPGAVFFHPKGLFLFHKLISHMRQKQEEAGYVEVATPRVMNRVLWERSGHWEKYGEHNYSGKTEDGSIYCIKPMNCPGGILVYNQGIKSYRDLPLKMSEFGQVNRYEPSGALHGLFRVREFTQDDAHVFCTPDQVEDECMKVLKFILQIYSDFGFNDVKIKLSTRPDNRIGSDEIWDITEGALHDALEKNGYEYTINAGEGAFYGPKLEFVLKDAIGRDWQCGTVQVDMNLPERFDMNYIGNDGQKHRPVMIHRALLGSIERFVGILIEEFEGKLPLWLAPTQIVVASITNEFDDYAVEVHKRLKEVGIRAELNLNNDKIGYKVRQHSLEKIPYIFVVGEREKEKKSVAIRTIGDDKQIIFGLDEAVKKLVKKIESREIEYGF